MVGAGWAACGIYGVVESGADLIEKITADLKPVIVNQGFAKLATFDVNNDGVIDEPATLRRSATLRILRSEPELHHAQKPRKTLPNCNSRLTL